MYGWMNGPNRPQPLSTARNQDTELRTVLADQEYLISLSHGRTQGRNVLRPSGRLGRDDSARGLSESSRSVAKRLEVRK